MKRKCGILLPVASLNGPFGIGTMGKYAYQFIDFLVQAGQSTWQILPLSPVDEVGSPYRSNSAFAGNPWLIDFQLLIDDGLLHTADISAFPKQQENEVIYAERIPERNRLLMKAFQNAKQQNQEKFSQYCKANSYWLEDYALFMALHEHYHTEKFQEWPKEVLDRNEKLLQELTYLLQEKILFQKFCQYLFHKQWGNLKTYAEQRGIEIVGDIPFYLSPNAVDVWAYPELFEIDEEKNAIRFAGCPPDAFSKEGQLWYNPLYHWQAHKKTRFHWWKQRIAHTLQWYHYLRLDHFRAFDSYWAIPANASTALEGTWCEGPGIAFFDAVKEVTENHHLLIAEDLGLLFEAVHHLRVQTGMPGMVVMQFAFNKAESSNYLLHKHQENSIVYSATHDNHTTAGWFAEGDKNEVMYAIQYLGLTQPEKYVDEFLCKTLSSNAKLAIIPLQDYLGLGNEARINIPGQKYGNWKWRVTKQQLNPGLAKKIHHMAKANNRT